MLALVGCGDSGDLPGIAKPGGPRPPEADQKAPASSSKSVRKTKASKKLAPGGTVEP